MRHLRASILLGCGALGACGGGGSGISAQNHIGAKPPKAILAAVSKALAHVSSYRFQGTQTDADGRSSIVGDVTSAGAVRFKLDNEGKMVRAIVLGSQAYVNANRLYWQGSGSPRLARLLAGRWVKVPTSSSAGLARSIRRLLPRELAHCLPRANGTITKAGTRNEHGQPVVVLQGAGNEPGTAPGQYLVATTGPPLPVRVIQTGPKQPGHRDPRCHDPESTVRRSDIRITGFDKPLHITAPPNALDLTKPGDHGDPSLTARVAATGSVRPTST